MDASDDAARHAVAAGDAFSAVHLRAGIKIDFFVAGSDAFEHGRLQRRIAIAVGAPPARTLWVDTSEHVKNVVKCDVKKGVRKRYQRYTPLHARPRVYSRPSSRFSSRSSSRT